MKRRHTKDFWEKTLTDLAEFSGTQAEFCQRQGITVSSLGYHLGARSKRVSACEGDSAVAFVAVGKNLGRHVELNIGPIVVKVWPESDRNALGIALRAAVEECGRT